MGVFMDIVLALVCISRIVPFSESARILAVVPVPSYSHQITFQELWKALGKRGHEIVLISSQPVIEADGLNITHISVKEDIRFVNDIDFVDVHFKRSWMEVFESEFLDVSHEFVKNIFQHPEVRKLYAPDSKAKFDLVMAEVLSTQAVYGLAHRFNAPLIGVASLGLISLNNFLLGDVVLPSHPSTWELEERTVVNLTFWQRLRNFIRIWYSIYYTVNNFLPQQEALMKRYLGNDLPSLYEICANVSLVFVNRNDIISYARPNLPNVIHFSFTRLSEKPKPLPNELNDFLKDATDGFVYFSFGTIVKSHHFPEMIKGILFDVLSNLPYKVLWKNEGEVSQKSDNILTAKWFPQQTLLAHPKIKMYICHGGLQSTEEAISYGVPVVIIPIFADQYHQALKLVSLGVGKYIEISTMTKDVLKDAIMDVATNGSYRENMLKLRDLIRDTPYDTVSNLIWWTEFVIRHKGAPHLRSVTMSEPWYQRQEVDVVAFLAIIIFTVLIFTILIIFKVSKHLLRRCVIIVTQRKVKTS